MIVPETRHVPYRATHAQTFFASEMNAPIRDAFDCSSRKPMRRHFVSGFPRALLSLSQEKSSGVEIETVPSAVRYI